VAVGVSPVRDSDPGVEPETLDDAELTNWESLIEDMSAMAEEYRDRGWAALEVHPGDIAAFPGEAGRRGIELLAPDNEFDPIAAAFDETAGFETAEVFRAVDGGMVYLLFVLEASDIETAVLLPAYYSHGNETEFVEMLETAVDVPVHVRPLNERRILTFTYDDPSLFLPPD